MVAYIYNYESEKKDVLKKCNSPHDAVEWIKQYADSLGFWAHDVYFNTTPHFYKRVYYLVPRVTGKIEIYFYLEVVECVHESLGGDD